MLVINQLEKTFREKKNAVRAVDGIDLAVKEGEFLVLLGPSGCGKSTTLRSVAGLERPDDGEISIDGVTLFSKKKRVEVPPEKRPLAMVFQSYAIWPHLNVYENVALPLRVGLRRLNKPERDQRVKEVLKLLGLEGLADRRVSALSGGQQQRVSLARAVAQRPRLLLMDEPLSNLDYKLRVRLRVELKELMQHLNLTTLYVTHDQEEALVMGDRIAVLSEGKIVQIGPPREVYERPQHEFAARFIGEMNFIPGEVKELKNGLVNLETTLGMFQCSYPSGQAPQIGEKRLLGIRPADIRLLNDNEGQTANLIQGQVIDSQYLGESVTYTMVSAGMRLQVKRHHSEQQKTGNTCRLYLPPEHCVAILPDQRDAAHVRRKEGSA